MCPFLYRVYSSPSILLHSLCYYFIKESNVYIPSFSLLPDPGDPLHGLAPLLGNWIANCLFNGCQLPICWPQHTWRVIKDILKHTHVANESSSPGVSRVRTWSFRHPLCLPSARSLSIESRIREEKDRGGFTLPPLSLDPVLPKASCVSNLPSYESYLLPLLVYCHCSWIAFTYCQIFWFNISKFISSPKVSSLIQKEEFPLSVNKTVTVVIIHA